MIQKIDVLMPTDSKYNVLHHFTLKMYDAMERAGYNCRLLHGRDRITATFKDPPDLTLCYNGAARDEEGNCLADLIRVPHIACLVDPPYRYFNLTASQFTILTCDDRFGCDFLKVTGFNNAVFMPHAVEKELCLEPEQEKIYDVVMLASFIDFEKRRENWKRKFPEPLYKALEQALEISLKDETTSFLWTVQQLVHPYLWTNEHTFNANLFYQIYEESESYLKGRNRVELINSIKDVPVHVFGGSIDKGRNWSQYYKGNTQVIVHPEISYLDALEVIKKSKVLLNSNIKNKQGAHERIFSGMASGAAVVTNHTPYMDELFVGGEDLILFDCNFEYVNERVMELLSSESERKKMTASAKQKVLESHTWDHRISQLFKDIEPIIEKMK